MIDERVYLGNHYTYLVCDTDLVSLPALEEIMNPDKSVMLERYREAYADMIAIADSASENFIYSSTYRNQCRRAAMSCGATAEEIREVEENVRIGL